MAEPSSKGIGSGTAQVFDTSAPVNAYLASKKEDEKRKEIAAQEARGMLTMFKDKDGWATRDGESYRKYYNSILDKYSSLGWENLTKDPAIQAEYMKDIAAFNAFIQASNEQKADWAKNDAIFREPANLDPATGNYTKDQQEKHEYIASKPIDYWLSNPEEYAKLREEAYTPKVNLKPPSEYVKTLAPPTNHLKTKSGSTVSDGNQVSYGNSGVDIDAWKAAVKVQYDENDAFRASVDQNYEGKIDEFLEVLPTLYTKTDTSYTSRPVGGGGGDVVYDSESVEYGFAIKSESGTNNNAVFSLYTKLPKGVESEQPFSQDTRIVSTGSRPSSSVSTKVSYESIGYLDHPVYGKGIFAIGSTTSPSRKGKKGSVSQTVIRPLDEVRPEIQQLIGKEWVESAVNDINSRQSGSGRFNSSDATTGGGASRFNK